MASSVVTQETAAEAQSAAPERDPLDDVWRFFASPRLAIALMLLIALVSLAGALIIQAPSEIVNNPRAQAPWLAQAARPKFGVFTDMLWTLQLFWVFQTVWFRALLGLLAVNTIVCTVNRLPGVWQAVFRPTVRPRDGLFERGSPRETVLLRGVGLDEALTHVRGALRQYRRVETREPGGVYAYADRFRLARFGTVSTHLALILFLIGVVASIPLGYFEEGSFAVPVGSTRDVGHQTGLSVYVDDFVDEYWPETGAPKDYRSDVVLYEDGTQVAQQTVHVNEPLIYKDVRFHQSFYGPAAVVRVTDANGDVMLDDAVPLTLRSTDGNRPVGFFSLPGRDLSVYLIGTAGKGDDRIQPGQLAVEAYAGPSNTPTYKTTLLQRVPAQVGDLTFAFEREKQFTGLRVVRDPSLPIIWLAATMLVFGTVVTFLLPHRRLWFRARAVGADVEVTLVGAGREQADAVRRAADALFAAVRGAERPNRVRTAAADGVPEHSAPVNESPQPRSARRARRSRGRAAAEQGLGPTARRL